MKKICSCLVILTFFSSCSDIDTNVIDTPQAMSLPAENNVPNAYRLVGEMPANSDNPYENAGHIYDEMLTTYYGSGNLPTNQSAISERVKYIANTMPGFNGLKSASYRDVQLDKVAYILDHTATCQNDIIDGSGLSAVGKLMLSSYINSVLFLNQKENEFRPIYDYICEFEASVMTSATLTAKDKRVIYLVTSISRYSIYKVKKRPKRNTDPDWTILIANLVGGTYGGDNDTAEALTTALVCGIAQN